MALDVPADFLKERLPEEPAPKEEGPKGWVNIYGYDSGYVIGLLFVFCGLGTLGWLSVPLQAIPFLMILDYWATTPLNLPAEEVTFTEEEYKETEAQDEQEKEK